MMYYFKIPRNNKSSFWGLWHVGWWSSSMGTTSSMGYAWYAAWYAWYAWYAAPVWVNIASVAVPRPDGWHVRHVVSALQRPWGPRPPWAPLERPDLLGNTVLCHTVLVVLCLTWSAFLSNQSCWISICQASGIQIHPNPTVRPPGVGGPGWGMPPMPGGPWRAFSESRAAYFLQDADEGSSAVQ